MDFFKDFNIVSLGGLTKDQIKAKIAILTAIKKELMKRKQILYILCKWLDNIKPRPLNYKQLKEILNREKAILEALCEIIDQLLVKCNCKLKALCLLEDIKKKEKQISELTAEFIKIRTAIFSTGKFCTFFKKLYINI